VDLKGSLLENVQGLMQAAIQASTEAMAGSIRRLLSELHKHKGAPGVDQLLLRLYQPILFRAMAVANPAVRLNALHLFLDAFPLQVWRLHDGNPPSHSFNGAAFIWEGTTTIKCTCLFHDKTHIRM
jgi:hypothetical protein